MNGTNWYEGCDSSGEVCSKQTIPYEATMVPMDSRNHVGRGPFVGQCINCCLFMENCILFLVRNVCGDIGFMAYNMGMLSLSYVTLKYNYGWKYVFHLARFTKNTQVDGFVEVRDHLIF